MIIEYGDKTSQAVGDFGHLAATIHSELEGRKQWKSPQRLAFESTEHNFRVLHSNFPELGERTEINREFDQSEPYRYDFVMKPRDYQLVCFNRFKNAKVWAMFSEPGTGKTKTCLDMLSYQFMTGRITGALILSYPKGVHRQWVEDQMPLHWWPSVPVIADWWNGKKPPAWLGKHTDEGQIFSGNIEMLTNLRPLSMIKAFLSRHKKVAIIIDESDCVKNFGSLRHKTLRKLVDTYKPVIKGIMTGTPIAKDLTDEWAQFYFLDPSILGHKYKTSFQGQYCRMGGFEGRAVIGHRNVDRFREITSPYVFRASKAELNLPPKITDEAVFDLSEEQHRLIRSIRDNFLAQTTQDRSIVASTGAVALLRMQQIASGFGVDENGDTHWLAENPRLERLSHVIDSLNGQSVIVWCRFINDIQAVKGLYCDRSVTIYGAVADGDRRVALERFKAGEVQILVANPAAIGRGVDGLQTACSYAIYYSNSFNAIERWQSEDRIHRLGMSGISPTYIDLIGRGSPDRGILRNLRNKKSLADLVLDDVRQLIQETD